MRNDILQTARRAVKNWWVSVLIGVLSVIVGIWCMATPDATLVALTILFIVAFLVSGIFEIILAVGNRDRRGWGWALAGGILDLVLGIILMVIPPVMTTLVLIYFVGFWLLIRSVWAIGFASDLSHVKNSGWGWLLTLAIIGVIFSILFFVSPLFGGGMIVWFAALAFIAYGFFRIYLGVRLRTLHNDLGEVARELEDLDEPFMP